MNNRIGEHNKNVSGEDMIICNYNNPLDITIMFKDGTKVYHTTYKNFKRGLISRSTNKDSTTSNVALIDMKVIDKEGKEGKIVEEYDDYVTIRYNEENIILNNISKIDAINGTYGIDIPKETYESRLLLSKEEKLRDLAEERERTYKNILYNLSRFRRCIMIRPCSFGKTWIGMRLFTRPEYKRCLFIHPVKDALSNPIIQKTKREHKDTYIETQTYNWLYEKNDKELAELDYDIVFFDECHKIGGDENGNGAFATYQAVKKLMYMHPKTHFVGATATPWRMDGLDVINDVFGGIACYPYTEKDAIEDGLIKKPYYMYCEYSIVEKVRKKLKEKEEKLRHKFSKDTAEKILGSEDIKKIDASQMPDHIRTGCDNYLDDTSYMRFIVFYLRIDDIKKNKKKVINWFKKAYPNHEINSIEVHSRSKEDLNSVDNLKVVSNRIDLIFNCEKLCLGYHSEYITGLVMDRKTESFSKYKQMIGRLISCDNEKPVIIFDIVDNLHTDFIIGDKADDPKINYKKLDKLIENLDKKSYSEIRKCFPDAIDWEYVYKNNNMVKDPKVDEKRAIFADNSLNIIRKTAEGIIINDKNNEINKKTPLDIAAEYIKENDLSFKDSIKIYNRASQIMGIDKTSVSLLSDHSNNIDDIDNKKEKTDSRFYNIYLDYEKKLKEYEVKTINKEKVEPLGYTPKTLALYNNKIYQRDYVNIIINEEDLDDFFDKLFKEPTEKLMKKIITKWHTYPGCEKDYQNYDEINKLSHSYKMLNACAKLYRCSVEPVLTYMIEKVA